MHVHVRLLGKVGQFLGRYGESGTVNKYTLEIVSFDILKYIITGESGRLLWYDWTAMGKVGQSINLRDK